MWITRTREEEKMTDLKCIACGTVCMAILMALMILL